MRVLAIGFAAVIVLVAGFVAWWYFHIRPISITVLSVRRVRHVENCDCDGSLEVRLRSAVNLRRLGNSTPVFVNAGLCPFDRAWYFRGSALYHNGVDIGDQP